VAQARPSLFRTVSLPVIGSANAFRLATSQDVPVRVVVRADAATGVTVRVAFSSSELTSEVTAGGNFYDIPSGQSEIFVMTEKQVMFGVGLAAGGIASIAVSEAVPIRLHK
jgi:hypothetical protein